MSQVMAELLFVGLLLTLAAPVRVSSCEILGSAGRPLLSRQGDVVIGGAFSIHSKIIQPPLLYQEKPAHLLCSR